MPPLRCVWELTKETIHLLLGCLQGGFERCTQPAESWAKFQSHPACRPLSMGARRSQKGPCNSCLWINSGAIEINHGAIHFSFRALHSTLVILDKFRKASRLHVALGDGADGTEKRPPYNSWRFTSFHSHNPAPVSCPAHHAQKLSGESSFAREHVRRFRNVCSQSLSAGFVRRVCSQELFADRELFSEFVD